ncbi:MAG: hypothetical protein GF341_08300 [candidate division Zixibacteria bacterium]|nr:hypothetical protein [candidate division Zixibacteria bacterium]
MRFSNLKFFLATLILLFGAVLFAGCGEEEDVDPVVKIKGKIPVIERSLNRNDLETLAEMGTDRFEPERFVQDVFSRGVSGDVLLKFQRVRVFPGESELTLLAHFGDRSQGGIKELTIGLAGEDYKLDTYTLRDRSIPGTQESEGILEEPRRLDDTATAADPS